MKFIIKLILSLIITLGFKSFCFAQNLEAREGFVNVEGGKIWYKIIGSGKKIPLLLIHGGPGGKSCSYIPVFSGLQNDRPIIIYDQLGSGRSEHVTDTSLFRLPRFVNEIDSLRAALNLKELHILGQSWGGTVLVEYLITKKPKGVKSAIFASPLLSTPIWMKDAKLLLSKLPKNVQDTINKYEELKEYTSASYRAATDSFYAKHLSIKQPTSAAAPECAGVASNSRIYNYMWGSTEFNATGTLKAFDRTPDLHKLKLPVLFITGEHDEARPETMYRFQKMVPHSRVSVIENAAHRIQIDQPLEFTDTIQQFIDAVK